MKSVTATAATGYAIWAAMQSPAITGGPLADQDNDGLTNGIEYAFGLDPNHATSPSALPTPTLNGATLGITFVQPAGISGVTYGVQWSTDLVTWMPLPDTGSSTTHIFSVNTTGLARCFVRHIITLSP